MKSLEYNKIVLSLIYLLFLVLLATFQMSFLNPSPWGLNLTLVLIIFLVFSKKNSLAFITAWISGFLIDLNHYSFFGISILSFLILAAVLAIFHKNIPVVSKRENLILMTAAAVFLSRFLDWSITNIFLYFSKHNLENIGFYFFNWKFLSEIFTTVVTVLIIFSFWENRSNNRKFKKINV